MASTGEEKKVKQPAGPPPDYLIKDAKEKKDKKDKAEKPDKKDKKDKKEKANKDGKENQEKKDKTDKKEKKDGCKPSGAVPPPGAPEQTGQAPAPATEGVGDKKRKKGAGGSDVPPSASAPVPAGASSGHAADAKKLKKEKDISKDKDRKDKDKREKKDKKEKKSKAPGDAAHGDNDSLWDLIGTQNDEIMMQSDSGDEGEQGSSGGAAARTNQEAALPKKPQGASPQARTPEADGAGEDAAEFWEEMMAEKQEKGSAAQDTQLELAVGCQAEGKYGDDWFGCTVLELGPEDAKVRWGYDGSEATLNRDKLRLVNPADIPATPEVAKEPEDVKPTASDPTETPVQDSCEHEAKYGNGWFPCTVLEKGPEWVKVKWGFDGSEAELALQDVRSMGGETKDGEADAKQDDERWVGIDPIEIGWEAAAFLLDSGGARKAKVEQACAVEMLVDPEGSAKISGDAQAVEHASEMLRAVEAMRSAKALEVSPLPTASNDRFTVILIPSEHQETVSGKGGNSSFLKLFDECGAVACFVEGQAEAQEPVQAEMARDNLRELEVHSMAEGMYGSSWFPCTVLDIGEDKVKVKWDFDSSEADLDKDQVRPAADTSAASVPKGELTAGQEGEGKFGNSWFAVTVLEVESDKVKVKWGYDGSEAEVDKDQVRAKEAYEPETSTIVIYGTYSARMKVEVKIASKVQQKLEKDMKSSFYKRKSVQDFPDICWIVLPLLHGGAQKSRCIGKQGSMMKKIASCTGVTLEFAFTEAWIVGSAVDCERCAAILNLVQEMVSNVPCENVPKILYEISSEISVPASKMGAVLGAAREILNALELELGVMCLNVPTRSPESDTPFEPTEGLDVEADYGGGKWHAASVVRVEGDSVLVKWGYDGSESEVTRQSVREKLEGDAAAARDLAASAKTLLVLGPKQSRETAEIRIRELAEGGGQWKSDDRSKSWGEEKSWGETKNWGEDNKWGEKSQWKEENKWGGAEDNKWGSSKEKQWGGGEDKGWGGSEDRSWSGRSDQKWGSTDRSWNSNEKNTSWSDDKGWSREGQSSWDDKRKWSETAQASSSQGALPYLDAGIDAKRPRQDDGPPLMPGPPMATPGVPAPWTTLPQQSLPSSQPGLPLAGVPSWLINEFSQPGLQSGPPPLSSASGFQQPMTDPAAVLQTIPKFPTTMEEWIQLQPLVWRGHPPLREGWIRCWSRSKRMEYYVRLVDMVSSFDLQEVLSGQRA